jgi:hypothetical protein
MKANLGDPRKYIETSPAQRSKKTGDVCGDYVLTDRTSEATTTVLADGIGSGIKAHIAAVMCASRLMELIRLGFTLREACKKIVDTMHEARTRDIPFAAFSVCRILNSGHATIISYEIPGPILINNRLAAYLPQQRSFSMGLEMISEVNCMLEYGDAIVLVSDGVSQAGLGHLFRLGWGTTNACDFVNGCLMQGTALGDIPERIISKVILTGPPEKKSKDKEIVPRFMEMKGAKVVCGSSTAEMVARHLGVPVRTKNISEAFHKPPSYEIEGIDYATEGAITLNQVYNILEEEARNLETDSSVSDLFRFFHASDRINFIVGTARNSGHENIVFRQMGVFPREVIVRLLAERLTNMGKLVNVEYIQCEDKKPSSGT